MRHLTAVVAACAIASAACQDTGATPPVTAKAAVDTADQTLFGIRLVLSDHGIQRALMQADTAFTYEDNSRTELRVVRSTFYTETGVKNGNLQASFTVKNVGKIAGKEVAQIYVAPVDAQWEAPKRLAGFRKVELKPGASATASVTVDPRLLAVYDSATKTWKVAAGTYRVILASSALDDKAVTTTVRLDAAVYDVNGRPVGSP